MVYTVYIDGIYNGKVGILKMQFFVSLFKGMIILFLVTIGIN